MCKEQPIFIRGSKTGGEVELTQCNLGACWISQTKGRETKEQPSKAQSGHEISCCLVATDENRLLFAHRGGILTSEMKPSISNKILIKSKSIQCKDGNYCVVLEVFSMCNIPPTMIKGNLAAYVNINGKCRAHSENPGTQA